MLTNMYPRSLGGTFIHEQARHIVSKGYEVQVVVPVVFSPKIINFIKKRWKIYSDIPKNDIIDAVRVYYPRYFRLPGWWFNNISCYTQYLGADKIISSIIKRFKPNVLHAHATTPPGYCGLLLKKKYHLPIVCSLRGSDINIYPQCGKLLRYQVAEVIKNADLLVSVSEALKIEAYNIATPPHGIRVVYNGCDLNTFSPNEATRTKIRNDFGILRNDKVLIYVGNLLEYKGIFELIAAFYKLLLDKPALNIFLFIVGDGPEHSTVNHIILSKGLKNKIHLIGNQPYNEVSKFLNAADIFILPSYSEGLPNAVLEAMACCLPVITTRVGGTSEAVEDGKSGILIPKKDVNSIIHAIKSLLNNAKLAKEMGNNGRKIIESKFSWNKNAEEMINIYKKVSGL